jgi:hypothetical protein
MFLQYQKEDQMGFFNKLLRNMPGCPKSIANNLLKYYLSYTAKFPDLNEKEIFRKILNEKYSFLFDSNDIDRIIAKADTLVELTIGVLSIAHRPSVSGQFSEETAGDIFNFFLENAPLEFEKFKNKVGQWAGHKV